MNVSEEMEILIAKRLLGEISKDENVKLEIFLQDNPEIKKSYFEKEGVKRLLVNAADNLEELQLPADKRNVLLNKFSSKSSGKFILYTYVAAASVFFAFMFGIYFYADKKLQDPEKTSAYTLKEYSKEDKADDDIIPAKAKGELDEKAVPQKDMEIPKGKEGSDTFGKMKGGEKQNPVLKELNDSVKDLNEEVDSLKDGASQEITRELRKLENHEKVEPKFDQKRENSPAKSEEKKVASAPPSATPRALNEESAKKKSGSNQTEVPEGDDSQNGQTRIEKLYKKDAIKAEKSAEANSKNDASQSDKHYGGGGSLDSKDAKRKEPVKEEGGLRGELNSVAVVQSHQFEYKAEFNFNESSYKINFKTDFDLSDNENVKKLNLRQVLTEAKKSPEEKEAGLEKETIQERESNKNASSRRASFQIFWYQSHNIGAGQKQPVASDKPAENNLADRNPSESKAAESKVVESKPGSLVPLSTEIALIYICNEQYQRRNDLTIDKRKTLLNNLKTTLSQISHFKDDPDLKTWIANIEKELK